MEKSTKAIQTFNKGFNCAQAVVSSFGTDLGLTEEQCLKVASAFGGGMGKQQSICGAVTGAYMVLGLKYGNITENNEDAKAKTYGLVQEFNKEFLKTNESLVCKDLLLGYDMNTEEGSNQIKEQNLKKLKCEKAIKDAVEAVEKLL